MARAKRPNEIREEVRKQMAAKYKANVEHWQNEAREWRQKWAMEKNRLSDLSDENAQLKEKVAAQQEWIERLMDFVNMPDDKRGEAVKKYVENRQMSEQFRALFGPYFDALNRLNILSL